MTHYRIFSTYEAALRRMRFLKHNEPTCAFAIHHPDDMQDVWAVYRVTAFGIYPCA